MTEKQQEAYERAKAMLHEHHINDLVDGTTGSKLTPIRGLGRPLVDGTFHAYRLKLEREGEAI